MAAEAAAVRVKTRPGIAEHLRGSSGLRAAPRLSPRRSAEAGPGQGLAPPSRRAGPRAEGSSPEGGRGVPRGCVGGGCRSAARGGGLKAVRARGSRWHQAATPEHRSNRGRARKGFQYRAEGVQWAWRPGLRVPGVSRTVERCHSPGGLTHRSQARLRLEWVWREPTRDGAA